MLCLWATKKIFLLFLRMNSNSCKNHGESRVYHQFRRNWISSKRSFVYHHCEKKCSLRLMIYTFGDEMHAYAWWYTIAFAMDKKSTGRNPSIFGRGTRTWTLSLRFWRPPLYQLSYTPIYNKEILYFVWWALRDSNPGLSGYEPEALTNWAKGP